jgi:hypothetical protein
MSLFYLLSTISPMAAVVLQDFIFFYSGRNWHSWDCLGLARVRRASGLTYAWSRHSLALKYKDSFDAADESFST